MRGAPLQVNTLHAPKVQGDSKLHGKGRSARTEALKSFYADGRASQTVLLTLSEKPGSFSALILAVPELLIEGRSSSALEEGPSYSCRPMQLQKLCGSEGRLRAKEKRTQFRLERVPKESPVQRQLYRAERSSMTKMTESNKATRRKKR